MIQGTGYRDHNTGFTAAVSQRQTTTTNPDAHTVHPAP
jgi:hypothetical protein